MQLFLQLLLKVQEQEAEIMVNLQELSKKYYKLFLGYKSQGQKSIPVCFKKHVRFLLHNPD